MAGPDFQYSVMGSSFERVGDPRQDSGIGQKMLSQPALGVRHC
jgi:hypothetical protein